MLTKNPINRNKMDNKAKSDNKILNLYHLYKIILMDISSGNRIHIVKASRTLNLLAFLGSLSNVGDTHIKSGSIIYPRETAKASPKGIL